MKVLHITVRDSVRACPTRRPQRQRALAILVGSALLGCHPARKPLGPALATPPVESIALRLPMPDREAWQLVRTILFRNGYQVHSENARAGWIRTNLGGLWEDQYRYRQWHIVVTSAHDPARSGTLVTLRALEVATQYAAGVRRTHSALDATNGFTRVLIVTDVTPGEARQAWVQMERLAFAITDRGGEMLTELVGRQ